MPFDFLANIFFPPICVACRRRVRRGVICRRCFRSIGIRDAISCGQCLTRLRADKGICHPDFPFLLGAAGRYENRAMKALIHHLKFRSIRGGAGALAALILRHIARAKIDLAGFVVMPIPLSQKRRRVRGYNQAELIAQHLASSLDLALEPNALVRAKHTKPQSETESVAERKENIQGAFSIQNPESVRGKNILLIDDVATTGATFLEAALALKAAGVNRIIALAAAKA